MKVFKWIYYPVMVLLFFAAAALGFDFYYYGGVNNTSDLNSVKQNYQTFVDFGSRNSENSSNLSSAKDKIKELLRDYSGNSQYAFYSGSTSGDGASFYTSDGAIKPSVVIKSTVISDDTIKESGIDNTVRYVGRTVYNVIAVIPGSDTLAAYGQTDAVYGDAVMFVAHYDTTLEDGGASNALAIANLIKTATDTVRSGVQYKNDIVFLFTDAKEEDNLGAYAFKYQFDGFYNLPSRVKAVYDFNLKSSTGSLIMAGAQANGGNANILGAYNLSSDGIYSDSLYSEIYKSEKTDADVFGVPALKFTTIKDQFTNTRSSGGTEYNSDLAGVLDTAMSSLVKNSGNINLDSLDAGTQASYMTYAFKGHVSYANYVSYIMGGVIIALLAAGLVFGALNKGYDLKKILLGLFAQLCVLAATLATLYVCYFVLGLVLSGFEVINIHSLGAVVYTNPGLVLSAAALACVFAVIYYSVFKKIFAVNAVNTVRGGVALFSLFAAVVCFAAPFAAYLLAPVAALQSLIMLITALIKDKYLKKFGRDIERLFLYVWPFIIALPVFLGAVTLLTASAKLILLPLYIGVFLMMASGILPYADYLRRPLSRLVAGLPPIKIKTKEVITKQVEDAAKKGKFNEVEVVETKVTKIKRTYSHPLTVTVAALLCSVAVVLFAAFGHAPGANLSTDFSYYNGIYKDSMVYVNDNGTTKLEIKDLDAYKYIAQYIEGFSWDSDKNAYVKEISTDISVTQPTVTQDTTNKKLLKVTLASEAPARTVIEISNFGLKGIETVTVTSSSKEYELDFTVCDEDEETYTIILPYAFSNSFTMEIDGSLTSADITITQYAQSSPFIDYKDSKTVFEQYSGASTKEINEVLNLSAMEVIMNKSLTF